MSQSKEMVRIITARKIITMDKAEPEALLCHGELITASGGLSALRSEYPRAELVNFGDATIVPGFNDAHQHPTICAEEAMQIDLSPERVPAITDLLNVLRDRATLTPPGEWILGFGYDEQRTGAIHALRRDDIDTVCPDHPVLVVSVTLHSGVVNSRGLELAQLRTRDDAPGGGELGVDATGRLTGVVVDQALYDLAFPAFTRRDTVVPVPTAADLENALKAFFVQLHSAGITSVGDALVGPAGWDLLASIDARGELSLRVNALGSYDHLEYFDEWCTKMVNVQARLRLGGIKTFADGAVNGGTCLVDTPVLGSTGHGLARATSAELSDIVRQVHERGLRVCVHANGDRAIRYVLDAADNAQQRFPRFDPRHRIEHTSIVTPDILERMHDLGVVAVPFAAYARAHGDKLRQYYEPERIEWMFAHRAMLDHGIAVAGSSDYPCGPFEPFYAIESCVTRKDRTGEIFGATQRISIYEALGLYTTGSAYASAEETSKGKLSPGYLADFAVLATDPLTVPRDSLSEVKVLETWVGAERVWRAEAPATPES